MNKAEFIITGVMKGGTTILYDFITSHPDVNKAKQKEIHYFTLNYDKGEQWYSEFFEDNGKLNGEASPTYFDLSLAKTIPTMINRHNNDAKIIVITRDPVERAISHFNHLVKVNKNEALEKLGAERFFNLPYSNAVVTSNMYSSLLFHVLNFSAYSQKLRIFKQEFGDRLLVLKNEELREAPYDTMEKVYNFLEIESTFKSDDFDKVRYSAGTSLDQLSEETQRKLREFFKEDQEATNKLLESL